jgi:hypothetical protein
MVLTGYGRVLRCRWEGERLNSRVTGVRFFQIRADGAEEVVAPFSYEKEDKASKRKESKSTGYRKPGNSTSGEGPRERCV